MLLYALVAFIKSIAWSLILGLLIIVMVVLTFYRYHDNIRDKIDFYRLKRLDITADKHGIIALMRLYQRMLQRHGLSRCQGHTIERFTQHLLHNKLINEVQAVKLSKLINTKFYLQQNQNHMTPNELVDKDDLKAFFIELYQYSLKQLRH